MPVSDGLTRQWWRPRPTLLSQALRPVAGLLQALVRLHRRWVLRANGPAMTLPAPVLVVGNLIVGGAGKTPTTLALCDRLRQRGWQPGVISRGYGRQGRELQEVRANSTAADVGDEPLLIHLRAGVPVCVGADRMAAARYLLDQHPELDLLISDDGLQHWRLPRQAQVLVFDGRGVGNGLTLPAGPLRQAMPAQAPARSLVLYNASAPSTSWPGSCARRTLGGAMALSAWWEGRRSTPTETRDQLRRLVQLSQKQPLIAAAGIGDPERFFSMLEEQGMVIQRCPLADHAALCPLPWPADAQDVLITEKDAVKLPPCVVDGQRLWVVTLDFQLPDEFIDAVDALLRQPPPPRHEP